MSLESSISVIMMTALVEVTDYITKDPLKVGLDENETVSLALLGSPIFKSFILLQ